MNPNLVKLQSYPFEKLAALKAGVTPATDKHHIALAVGEPTHPPPGFIAEEIIAHLHYLSNYPVTRGSDTLREAIAEWLVRRFTLPQQSIDPQRHVLPVNGTREALFAFAQCVIDDGTSALVLMPNPFYQIYEGATLLAGAEPWYLNASAEYGFIPDYDQVPAQIWSRCQLLYLCSPDNPSGAVTDQATLIKLIELAHQHDFVIAADECYSEIYSQEDNPPSGLLAAAVALGREDFKRCIVFNSLSKRSSVPGLRSGFVAGDASIIAQFLRYRTYHGCAMPLSSQAASTQAWRDDTHVQENRALYREKIIAVSELLAPVLDLPHPAGGFCLWPRTPIEDTSFARQLYARHHVSVLPGSYLSREAHGVNPGKNRVRIALVAPKEECIEAAERIREFVTQL